MLYGFLLTLFVILCALLVIIIMIQKGKSSAGLGNLGGSTQMLFGGSGGQDMFQKITWIMGGLFLAGSLLLAIMKAQRTIGSFNTQAPIEMPAPVDTADQE